MGGPVVLPLLLEPAEWVGASCSRLLLLLLLVAAGAAEGSEGLRMARSGCLSQPARPRPAQRSVHPTRGLLAGRTLAQQHARHRLYGMTTFPLALVRTLHRHR